MKLETFFDELIAEALQECVSQEVLIYTFSMYFDDLNGTVSFSFDTRENSQNALKSHQSKQREGFIIALKNDDLDALTKLRLDETRNLSIGDFELVGVCRTEVGFPESDLDEFYLHMMKAIVRNETKVLNASVDANELVFCCSGPLDDAQFVWVANSEPSA